MSESRLDRTAALERKLGGAEKVAALLLAMGKPAASRLLKHFDESEIRKIARTVSALGTVSKPLLEDLVDEFTHGVAAGQDLLGGIDNVEELLTGVVPGDQMNEILSDVRGDSAKLVWPRIARMPEPVLAQYLSREHPQVAAFILSRLAPTLAAAVIAKFPAELRNEIVRRMVAIKPVSAEPLRVVEETLQVDLLQKAARSGSSDAHARLAEIMNKLERQQMNDILDSLMQHRPKEARRVKKLLFTFEDIAQMTAANRGKLVDQIPTERTMLALRGADATLQDIILSCLSGRSRRMIEQELSSGAPVPQKEIMAARRAIADLALDLASRGQLELGPEGEEDDDE